MARACINHIHQSGVEYIMGMGISGTGIVRVAALNVVEVPVATAKLGERSTLVEPQYSIRIGVRDEGQQIKLKQKAQACRQGRE